MKLPPNFTIQKFTGDPRDKDEQLYFQLQQMYIQIANATNATIDDASFFSKERITSDIWVDGKAVWTYTVATGPLSTGTTPVTLGITAGKTGYLYIFKIECAVSDGTATTSDTLPVPYVDVTTPDNEIQLVRNGLTVNIISGGTDYTNYSGFITLYYTKA